jgi:hypothetical protein
MKHTLSNPGHYSIDEQFSDQKIKNELSDSFLKRPIWAREGIQLKLFGEYEIEDVSRLKTISLLKRAHYFLKNRLTSITSLYRIISEIFSDGSILFNQDLILRDEESLLKAIQEVIQKNDYTFKQTIQL